MALLKMTILAFKSFDNPVDLLKPRLFTAMFNPASYKVEHSLKKDEKEASGQISQVSELTAVEPKKMSFDFLIDGTGANGELRVVLVETKKFETMVMPEKKNSSAATSLLNANALNAGMSSHPKLPKLLLLWGTFVFPCEIDTFSFNYSLFNQFGIPLRATISATFKEVQPKPELSLLDSFNNSEVVDTITNVASFLSTAFSLTNSVVKAVDMARDENLNSIRQNITI